MRTSFTNSLPASALILAIAGCFFLSATRGSGVTTFQSGSLNAAGNWDNGLPQPGNPGTIANDGTTTETVFGFGRDSLTTLTAGTIVANDGFNITSGTWEISGGKVVARYFLANGAGSTFYLSGGTLELSDVASTQLMGVANGGTWEVLGTAVLEGSQATVEIQIGGTLDIASDWTGSWTWGTYRGNDWKDLLTGQANVTVDGAPIDGADFDALFVVSEDGRTLRMGSPDRPSDIHLEGSTVAAAAPVGTRVGLLTSTDPNPGDRFTYRLVEGVGSSHNDWFRIDGDRLEVGRQLGDLPPILNVRVSSTDLAGHRAEKSFSLTLVIDSDGDGLPDDWELSYFDDLSVATASGNNDGDALDNRGELERGSNPTLADSDGDGLPDDLESGSGVFQSALDPGSNPSLADSDGDGLSDAEEIQASPGLASDPNRVDSDDDGFPDPFERNAGTDPLDSGDFPPGRPPLRINEILARNEAGFEDGFGRREDWIEIHNPHSEAVDLEGYFLTDDPAQPTQWSFPALSLPAGGHLLVFASGQDLIDPGGHPHCNFRLSGEGEFLALIRPDGVTIDDAFSPSFPEQFSDVSYGRDPTSLALRFFESATPGEANLSTGFPGVVKDTNFSVNRGFFDAPFQVSISSDTPGAVIRYTTDGSLPSATAGTISRPGEPIEISATTTLRAMAFRSGLLPTNVDTHTYLFLEEVASQPADPPGWPDTWGRITRGIVPADYEMDPRVVENEHGQGVYSITEALLDLPSVSISLPPDHFLGPRNGIYTHPLERWERYCSLEYLHPDGTPGFQEDCKIEIHGNSSRNPYRMQKHSMRLTFSSEVGVPKLHYPLFPDSPVEEFNKLVLRACFTDSWGLASWAPRRYRPNDSMYIRDVWMKDSLGAMGQPTSHGNFVHLYVNGLYWGMHNLTERIEDDFLADHLGGEKEDWEVNEDFRDPEPRWNTMFSIDPATPSGYARIQDYLDVENFADYMLLHFYGDAEDWMDANGYAAANALSGDGKYRFFVWDQEIVLDQFNWNRYNSTGRVSSLFLQLERNDEFRMLFADRVQKHLFNGGALSESQSIARFLARCHEIDKAIVAESARWGDVAATTPYGNTPRSSNNIDADDYPPVLNIPPYFTREQHWVVERDNVTGHYIPTLHDQSDPRSIVRELREENLFPSINAPVFGQHGGVLDPGSEVTLSSEVGDIYYTLDGSDPRETGGSINPGAGMLTGGLTTVSLIDLEESGWRYLDTGVPQSDSEVVPGHPDWSVADWKHRDFDDSAWKSGQAMLGYGAISGRTIQTRIEPSSNPRHPTSYFRKEFEVSSASSFQDLTVNLIRDDGAIVYLNGRELERTNLGPGNQRFADLALENASPEGELLSLGSYELRPGDLVEGRNVLAVELHQRSTNSSDLGLDVELSGTRTSDGSEGLVLTQTGTVKARALFNGEWSALVEAPFLVGNPASPGQIAITEIHYHPAEADEGTEFIELMNIDPDRVIDLTGVSFVGISYIFPEGFTLAPRERVVIVRDRDAFAAAYDIVGLTLAPGSFAPSRLDNGGEEIALVARDGTTDLVRFRYDDAFPWPARPDGEGPSLVLIAPGSGPEHGDPLNWRASLLPGGNPGGSDAAAPFSGDPESDADGDGLSALLEHALGTSDADPNDSAIFTTRLVRLVDDSSVGRDYPVVTFRRPRGADDLIYEIQTSSDLESWQNTGTLLVSSIPHVDGTETVSYRSITPVTPGSREFIRLRVRMR